MAVDAWRKERQDTNTAIREWQNAKTEEEREKWNRIIEERQKKSQDVNNDGKGSIEEAQDEIRRREYHMLKDKSSLKSWARNKVLDSSAETGITLDENPSYLHQFQEVQAKANPVDSPEPKGLGNIIPWEQGQGMIDQGWNSFATDDGPFGYDANGDGNKGFWSVQSHKGGPLDFAPNMLPSENNPNADRALNADEVRKLAETYTGYNFTIDPQGRGYYAGMSDLGKKNETRSRNTPSQQYESMVANTASQQADQQVAQVQGGSIPQTQPQPQQGYARQVLMNMLQPRQSQDYTQNLIKEIIKYLQR